MAFLFGLFILSFMVPVALPYAAAGVQYQMISVGGHPQAYAIMSILVDFTLMMVVPPFVGLAIEEESERRKKEEES